MTVFVAFQPVRRKVRLAEEPPLQNYCLNCSIGIPVGRKYCSQICQDEADDRQRRIDDHWWDDEEYSGQEEVEEETVNEEHFDDPVLMFNTLLEERNEMLAKVAELLTVDGLHHKRKTACERLWDRLINWRSVSNYSAAMLNSMYRCVFAENEGNGIVYYLDNPD